jgi:hypothetical protein
LEALVSLILPERILRQAHRFVYSFALTLDYLSTLREQNAWPYVYGPEVQCLPLDVPLEDVIMLLKCDGGVIIEKFVSLESIDKAYGEICPKMEESRMEGGLFPSMFAPQFIHLSPLVRIRAKPNVAQE